MAAHKYIQIRVSEERKQRWKQSVEDDPEWRSLTHLIVTSVEIQLQEAEPGGAQEIDLGPVHEEFDQLGEQLDTIEDRLDETYFLVREDESDYTKITARIHDLIPVVPDREVILSRTPGADADPREAAQETGSVSHLVRFLANEEGFKPLDIKDAIERLDRESATVEATYARPQEELDKRVYKVGEQR